jgi:hypothetical protein
MLMPERRLCRAIRIHTAAALRVAALAALAAALVTAPLSAQRIGWWSRPAPWSLLLVGGGSYALSDVEIVPGTDQNGGWSWDAGLRLQRGRGAIGAGFEQTRFDVGSDGAATTSGIYLEPRLGLGLGTRGSGPRPYVFLHGAWIFDYDVDDCCSVYSTSQSADGWSYGAGFGLTSVPVGFVRFDLSASVSRLSGESDVENFQSWKGAGPVVAIRLGASVPLIGGR